MRNNYIQHDEVVIFNKQLKAVDCSPALLMRFKDQYQDGSFLAKQFIDFYAPDLEDLGKLHLFQEVATNGGAFTIDCYYTVTDKLKMPFYDRICVFNYNNLIFTVHYDISREYKYTQGSAELQNLRYLLNHKQDTVDVLTRLRDSNLTHEQRILVDSLLASVDSVNRETVSNLSQIFGLTKREQQIMALIAQGKSTQDISEITVLSPRTIDYHRDNIRKKMHLTGSSLTLYEYLTGLGLKKAE